MFSEAFVLAVDLFKKKLIEEGYPNMQAYPGLVKVEVGNWRLECHAQEGEKLEGLDPFMVGVFYNGITAGLLSPAGGSMVDSPDANEDELIAALREAGAVA